MVTVSHIAHKFVDEKPYLREAISKGIASYGSIAKQLKPDIEKELGQTISSVIFEVYDCLDAG